MGIPGTGSCFIMAMGFAVVAVRVSGVAPAGGEGQSGYKKEQKSDFHALRNFVFRNI